MPRRREARSFVLLVVLIIVAAAMLIATSLLFMVHADLAGQTRAHQAPQSRALALSGLQIVMVRLNEQRDGILNGERPRLDEEYVIYETDGRSGVVRLLPMAGMDERLVPEAGKLDLNAVDAQTLIDTGLVDPVTAGRIVQFRDAEAGGSFQSVAELLHVPGMTVEAVYGPLDDLTVMDQAQRRVEDLGGRIGDRLGLRGVDAAARGLADLLTVYSVEPALQRNGKLRINLNVPWSEELGRRIEERFGPGSADMLRGIFDGGATFESKARVFETMRSLGMGPEEWRDPADALTTEPGPFIFGRLDINTASAEALAALPAVDEDAAAAIVETRETLAPGDLATVVWPVIEGILEPEVYDEIGGLITTRSWTYRLRLAAGEVVIGDGDAGGAGGTVAGGDEARLLDPIIYEAVIDLSGVQPRVAYLRELTMLQTAALLVAASPESDEPDDEEAMAADDATLAGASEAAPGDPGFGDLDPGDDLEFGGLDLGGDGGAGGGSDGGGAAMASGPGRSPGGAASGGSASSDRRRRIGRWHSGR